MNQDQFTSERRLARYRELASGRISAARREELLRLLREEDRLLFAGDRGLSGTPRSSGRSLQADPVKLG